MWMLLLTSLCAHSLTEVPESAWTPLLEEHGIEVWVYKPEGRDLPVFRAKGVFTENLYEILAVLDDVPRHTQWMDRMAESLEVEKDNDLDRILYNRFDVPWPISDRDSLIHIQADFSAKKQLANFAFTRVAHALVPELEDVVRVPKMESYAALRYLDEKRTEVTFVIDIDPGGRIPTWIVKWIMRRIPLKILRQLKEQITKTRGQYHGFISRYRPVHAPPTRSTKQVH